MNAMWRAITVAFLIPWLLSSCMQGQGESSSEDMGGRTRLGQGEGNVDAIVSTIVETGVKLSWPEGYKLNESIEREFIEKNFVNASEKSEYPPGEFVDYTKALNLCAWSLYGSENAADSDKLIAAAEMFQATDSSRTATLPEDTYAAEALAAAKLGDASWLSDYAEANGCEAHFE